MNLTSRRVVSPFVILIVFYLTIILVSCGEDSTPGITNPPEPVDSSQFYYPKKPDSRWNYTRIQSVENIRPDSINRYFTSYPLTSTGYIKILYDTLIAGETLKVFLEEFSDSTGTLTSRRYYKMDTTSMVSFAYRGVGGTTMPFRPGFGGVSINFERNGIDMWQSTYGIRGADDSLIFEEDRPVVLKYPVVTGKEWIFRALGSTVFTKRYTGFENVHIDTAVYACMKVQRTLSNQSNYVLYDYVSKYGQVKRDYLFKNSQVTNMFGQTIGYVDYRDVVLVTSISGIE
ncbi:MAG: hypothetical protein IAE90_04185 [Ignavibacteria bacterium]|nr:hypothetical protein [Ignavibacteria bacterium]